MQKGLSMFSKRPDQTPQEIDCEVIEFEREKYQALLLQVYLGLQRIRDSLKSDEGLNS